MWISLLSVFWHSTLWTMFKSFSGVVDIRCKMHRILTREVHRYHNPEASLEEGLATLKRCIDEIGKRLVIAPGKFKVKVVDKDGVREVEL
jgi:hypothetical protein